MHESALKKLRYDSNVKAVAELWDVCNNRTKFYIHYKEISCNQFSLHYSGCSFPRGYADIVRRKCRYLTGNIHKSWINIIVFHQLYHFELVCVLYTLNVNKCSSHATNVYFSHRKVALLSHVRRKQQIKKTPCSGAQCGRWTSALGVSIVYR